MNIMPKLIKSSPQDIQIDFSPYSVRIAGRLVRVHAFAVLLCFSRKL